MGSVDFSKYSIPVNYLIKTNATGLKGLYRQGKNGEKQLWDHQFSILAVSRTYGKIVIASRNALANQNFIKLSNFKGENILNIPFADVIMGENFLYIYTFVNTETGEMGWYFIEDGFENERYIGDFQIVDRDTMLPYNIPFNKEIIKIKDAEGEKRLELKTGRIEHIVTEVDREKLLQERRNVTSCDVVIDNRSIALVNSNDGFVISKTNNIGDLTKHIPLIINLLGNKESSTKTKAVIDKKKTVDISTTVIKNVDKTAADKLVQIIGMLENYCNPLIIKVLHQYVTERLGTYSDDEYELVLDGILYELTNDWAQMENDKIVGYLIGSTLVTLVSVNGNGITVSPLEIITNSKTILKEEELEGLKKAYTANRLKTAKLLLERSELKATADDYETTKKFTPPYSVSSRESLKNDIKDYRYKIVKLYDYVGKIVDNNDNSHGNIQLYIAICNDFCYDSRLVNKNNRCLEHSCPNYRQRVANGEKDSRCTKKDCVSWIETNINHVFTFK